MSSIVSRLIYRGLHKKPYTKPVETEDFVKLFGQRIFKQGADFFSKVKFFTTLNEAIRIGEIKETFADNLKAALEINPETRKQIEQAAIATLEKRDKIRTTTKNYDYQYTVDMPMDGVYLERCTNTGEYD